MLCIKAYDAGKPTCITYYTITHEWNAGASGLVTKVSYMCVVKIILLV